MTDVVLQQQQVLPVDTWQVIATFVPCRIIKYVELSCKMMNKVFASDSTERIWQAIYSTQIGPLSEAQQELGQSYHEKVERVEKSIAGLKHVRLFHQPFFQQLV